MGLLSFLHRRKRTPPNTPQPHTAVEANTAELSPRMLARGALTAHEVTVFDGDTETSTNLAEFMNVPPNTRQYTIQISGLAQNPAMIFAEPPPPHTHNQEVCQESRQGMAEAGRTFSEAPHHMSNFSELAANVKPTTDSESLQLGENSGVNVDSLTLRETPRKKYQVHRRHRYSVAPSEFATWSYIEPQAEDSARPLQNRRDVPVFSFMNSFRRRTTISSPKNSDFSLQELSLAVANNTHCSDWTTDITAQIDSLIDMYSSLTDEDIHPDVHTSSMPDVMTEIDSVMDMYSSNVREENGEHPMITMNPPLAITAAYTVSPSRPSHVRSQPTHDPALLRPGWPTYFAPRPLARNQLIALKSDPIARPKPPMNLGRTQQRPVGLQRAPPYYPQSRARPNFLRTRPLEMRLTPAHHSRTDVFCKQQNQEESDPHLEDGA